MDYKILLIEDDRVDQMAFERLVKRQGLPYKYTIAGSVSEAREKLDSDKFDVVITDYRLGDGTAFDLFDYIVDTPCIFVTGAGDEETAIRAMKAGAYDYLIKDHERNYLKVLPLTAENAVARKNAEERLRLLESVAINANDAIVICDGDKREILYVNEAFTEMTGYSLQEVMNRSISILQGPQTGGSELDKIRQMLDRGKPVRAELINYRKDTSEFWVECNIVPIIDKNGAVTHWISIQRDITERKRSEEEKERLIKEIEAVNEDLTELNKELETIGAERTMSLMALTVADRVRNPATVIGGLSKRILEKEAISDKLRENLLQIVDESEKLDAIVKDFQALLDSRKSMFRNDDINKIMEGVVPIIEKEAASKEVKIVVDISKKPLFINMQKQLLRVAFFHVMRNAVDATSKGGCITVRTFGESNSAVLTISDTGLGIPKSDVDKIFDPFYSTKKHGFGMGLPLVKQILSEHLGDLEVESMPGKGSIFKIKFPVSWMEKSASH